MPSGMRTEKVKWSCSQCKTVKYLLPCEANFKKYCSPECYHAAGMSEEQKEILRQISLEQFKDGMPQETKNKIKEILADPKIKEKIKRVNHYTYGKEHRGEKSRAWLGDAVGKAGRHSRVKKLKGKASTHKCIDCGKQARDWSNKDHLYSLNPDDYQPRCRKCHMHYDRIFNNTIVDSHKKYDIQLAKNNKIKTIIYLLKSIIKQK